MITFMIMALTVLTSNVNGIHDYHKWSDLWQALPKHDIICLQETHLCTSQERSFGLYAQSYDYFFSHGTSASAGVCVLVKRTSGIIAVKSGEIPGKLVALHLTRDFNGLDMIVVCIYAPSDPSQRTTFFDCVPSFCTEHTLLLGDFNLVTDMSDRSSSNLDPTSLQLQHMLTSLNFHEPPGSQQNTFTYFHPSLSSWKSRIDWCYTNFKNNWVGYATLACFSDHYMVGLFVPPPDEVGPRPWHFPSDLLEDNKFVQQIELVLSGFNIKNPLLSWDIIKAKIQDLARYTTCFRQKQAQLELSSLKKTLKEVNKIIYKGEHMDADRMLLENKIMNIKERAWFFDHDDFSDWVDIEGTMTSTFLHLEDVHFSPFLDKLWIDSQVSGDLSLILDETYSFYSSLYAKQDLKTDQEIDAFLDSLIDLLTVAGDTSLMTAEIIISEIEQAIKQLKIGKAPGCDGLTSAFYKYFDEHLVPMLCEVFNYAFKNKKLSISQYLAIIVLLFKKGDQLALNNYRPISLTNADYKILAYILTACLSEHLSFLISPQ